MPGRAAGPPCVGRGGAESAVVQVADVVLRQEPGRGAGVADASVDVFVDAAERGAELGVQQAERGVGPAGLVEQQAPAGVVQGCALEGVDLVDDQHVAAAQDEFLDRDLVGDAVAVVHAAGPQNTVSPGSGDCLSVEDSALGCLPGLRPDRPRSDRSFGFFLYGLSDDGGFDDVEEPFPSRCRSSPTCAASAATWVTWAASCAAASSSRSRAACRSRAFASSSSATRARSHATSSGEGTCGVSGTRCTPSQPASSHQGDTPHQSVPSNPHITPAEPSITQAE